jgi:NAD(P)-dependent dehydrogenase (short-subunit alcohol dehydrogenase family)
MIDLGLDGKRAIVAGAGYRPERAGHGRATALRLAAAGATVACIDIDDTRAKAIVSEIESAGGSAFPIIADMTDSAASAAAVDEAVAGLGGVDVCVDIIGQATWGKVEEFTNEDWDWGITQNVTHVFYLYRAVAPHMIRQGTGGSLAAIASVDGIGSSSLHVSYGVAKAGIISLTKTFAEELGPHGIRVNAVAPGNVGGGNWDEPDVPFGSNPTNPLHPPRAIDIANGLLFLSSSLAARVTGQTLVVDGGATIRSPWGFSAAQLSTFRDGLPG